VNDITGNLEQYSQAGALLSIGPNVGQLGPAVGGEFNLAPTTTPEPGTLKCSSRAFSGLREFFAARSTCSAIESFDLISRGNRSGFLVCAQPCLGK
jgi:hypothetical protein